MLYKPLSHLVLFVHHHNVYSDNQFTRVRNWIGLQYPLRVVDDDYFEAVVWTWPQKPRPRVLADMHDKNPPYPRTIITENIFEFCRPSQDGDVFKWITYFRLIDWIEFYAVSAIFQPCNGGQILNNIPSINQMTKSVVEFFMYIYRYVTLVFYILPHYVRQNID